MHGMLHPQARAALENEIGAAPVHDPSTDIEADRAAARAAGMASAKEGVGSVADHDADGVLIRVYLPVGAAPLVPAIVHIHGGGFVFNDIEVHDAVCRRLVNRSGLAVVSIDYRRPPEEKFPVAVDDTLAAIDWLVGKGGEVGIDTERLVIHGDSSGGNLALVAALNRPGVFAAAALIYPFLDPHQEGASYDAAPGLFDREEAAWYWQQYARSAEDFNNPDLNPLESSSLGTLPPTMVVTAEHDPLRDEGELLAARIADAGVPCIGVRYLGMLHGFWRHADEFDAAEPLMFQVAGFLGSHV